VRHAGANHELATLVEEFGVPIATTTMGKGAYPEHESLAVGCIGRSGNGHANRAARECDVLIAIGTHFSDIDTGGWSLFDIPGATRLIHVDIDAEEIGRNYPVDVGIISDARLAINSLVEELRAVGLNSDSFARWREDIARWREEFSNSVRALRDDPTTPLRYGYVCNTVGRVLIETCPNASVFVDTGHLLSFAPVFLEQRSPTFFHCGFFHRMGWSLPAALGAKFARPDEPAVVLMGDGSYIFSSAALATAHEYDMPLVVLVMNNGSLQIERELMLRKYGRSAFVDYKHEASGEMWGPDYVMIAEAMGASATRVTAPDDLEPAIRSALESGNTHVIDVDIDVSSDGYRAVWYPYPDDFWTPAHELEKTF
jgi:acetolactate synthase-1/2/3 large subunit